MKWLFIVTAVVVLGSCSKESERTYTVDEFIADGALLTRTISGCRENPGELRNIPNCQNAEAADGKLRLQNMRKALGS